MKRDIEKQLQFIEEILGQPLNRHQIEQFDQYLNLLLEYNRRTNLTSITNPQDVIIYHFSDSLTCLWETGNLKAAKAIDVGTGGGFPGIPLKIACPELKLTLVESVSKKSRFLELVVNSLGLKEVYIINKRAEEVGQDPRFREQFDWALSRAVAPLAILAEYLLPLVKVGGSMLAMKSEDIEQEYAESLNAVEVLGGAESGIRKVQLSASRFGGNLEEECKITRRLVVFNKIREASARYPRRAGVPKKRPLH